MDWERHRYLGLKIAVVSFLLWNVLAPASDALVWTVVRIPVAIAFVVGIVVQIYAWLRRR